MEWLTFVVVDPVKAMFIKIWSYIPSLAGAIAILVIGWFLAKLIEAVVVRALKAVRLDAMSDKAGVAGILAHGDMRMTVSELIGAVVYWLVILVVIATSLNALNLTIAASLISRLVEYVPNIIGAIFVLIIGSFLASFVATVVKTAASNAGITGAKMLSQVARMIIVIFSVIIAVEQLNVATALIALAVNVILASIGIGIAIAFGLGCKDIAGKAMAEWLSNFKK